MILRADFEAMDRIVNYGLEDDDCQTCKGRGEVLQEVESFGTWEAWFPCEDCGGSGKC